MGPKRGGGNNPLSSDDTHTTTLDGPGLFPFNYNNLGGILQQALRSSVGKGNTNPVLLPKKFVFETHRPGSCKGIRSRCIAEGQDYMKSLCAGRWQSVPNAGQSGCKYFLTKCEEFIIKTIPAREHECLMDILPRLYGSLRDNRETMLPKFFGLYTYKGGGKTIRFVVMNNLLPSDIYIDKRYDLKGATRRKKSSTVCKDMEFNRDYPRGFKLDGACFNRLGELFELDCKHLKEMDIINYSLFIAVHNVESGDQVDTMRATSKNISSHTLSSHSLGLCGSRSHGVPGEIANGRLVLLYMGIIHIQQTYTFGRKVEHFFKSIFPGGNKTPVQPPRQFEERFLKHVMNNWFRPKKNAGTSF